MTDKKIRVGLNGFGRIGQAFMRISESLDTIEVVAINTRSTQSEMMAYQLQYDSIYGRTEFEVDYTDSALIVDGRSITTSRNSNPADIDWNASKVDVVVDATGAFKTRETLSVHLGGSVKKVLLTCPAKDDTVPMVVIGVNDWEQDFATGDIFSNASCTTNCAAPVLKALDDAFSIKHGLLTTVHAYTSSQSLVDDKAGTKALSRSAATNIIPSTTGAAVAVGKVIPSLLGKLDGVSLRVPVPNGSIADMVLEVDQDVTVEQVNSALRDAAEGELAGILGYEQQTLVSGDYIGDPRSAIFDPNYTKVVEGSMIKVFAWYDNEWGYSNRLTDLVEKLGESL